MERFLRTPSRGRSCARQGDSPYDREGCVLSQPSLPLDDPAGLESAPDELAEVRRRLDSEDLTVLAYRFQGDRFCGAARFQAYSDALGDRFVGSALPDSAAKWEGLAPFYEQVVGSPHSVVTAHLIDEAGQPTVAARDEILRFFAARLAPDAAAPA